MLKTIIYACPLLLLLSCQSDLSKEEKGLPVIQQMATPCEEGAEGRLFTSATGEVYLSWVEFLNDSTDALRFARLDLTSERRYSLSQPFYRILGRLDDFF